jgi:flagellar biosynthesis/type III secretory pathway M-ring protein FliF/YscJ
MDDLKIQKKKISNFVANYYRKQKFISGTHHHFCIRISGVLLLGNEQKYRTLQTNLKVDYYQVASKIKLEKNKK